MTGESFEVIYRSRPVMKISLINSNEDKYSGYNVGRRLDSLVANLPKVSKDLKDKNKSYKQLRDELYKKDAKYLEYME